MKKKILLISYHYPPSMAVGGLRIANFARYLPEQGWQPYVLTVEDRYLEQVDPNRLVGLEHAPIAKAPKAPTVSDLYLSLKSRLGRQERKTDGAETVSLAKAISPNAGRNGAEGAKQKLKRYLFSLLLSLPDGERSWVVPAVLKALRVIKRERISTVLTSCPPYSVHLIGLALKLITGVRWVADFRDPWITGSQKRLYYTSRLSMAIERRLEHLVLRKADRVLVNTANLTRLLLRTHGDLSRRKVMQLPNGFNPDRYRPYRQQEKYRRFTITYAGSLYFGRTPEPLFEAIKALIDAGTIRPEQIGVKLVGQCDRIEGRATEAVISCYALEGVVDLIPPVSYDEAMTIVAKSHLALLLAPDQPYQIPAKVFDYFGVCTPVLTFAGEGATADIVRSTRTGEVFSPNDIDGIAAFLASTLSSSVAADRPQASANLKALDIRHIVSTLAMQLNDICRFETNNRRDMAIALNHNRS